MDKIPLKIITLFSGVGMQERGIENSGIYDMEVLHCCEMNDKANISYAAIHNGLTPELIQNYNYPDRQTMADDLIKLNMGYDFLKNKPKNWQKMVNSDTMELNTAWLACKLSKNLGDISKIKSIPYCDLLTFSFPCLTGDTLVFAEQGNKYIKDIKIGDKVLTHNNRFKQVTHIKSTGKHTIYEIQVDCADIIRCTDNHQWYVCEKTNIIPKFITTDKLTTEHYLYVPFYENIVDNDLQNQDFWWIIGKYISDGKLCYDKNGIIINSNYTNEIIGVLDRLKWVYNKATADKIHIVHKELALFCEQFGNEAINKHLSPLIFNLPLNLLNKFVDGYLSGNECTQNNNIYSISKQLIYDMGIVISKLYHIPYTIYKNNIDVVENKAAENKMHPVYELKWQKQNNYTNAIVTDKGVYYRIKNIINTNTIEETYDITVEDDHTFLANNIVTHNCTDLSVAGKRQGFTSNTRSGLVYEVTRILNNSPKPKYLLMENVKNLIGKQFLNDYLLLNREFSNIGYNCYYDVLNSKNCGVPQSRERVFGIYIRKDIDSGKYIFPQPYDTGVRIKHILQKDISPKYYLNNVHTKQVIEEAIKDGKLT